MASDLPRLYTDLASWYFLLTAREDYVEEEQIYRDAILAACSNPPRTLLELGCGGGNMAWHYKRWVQATLTDISPQMLELSRSQNPECEHVRGDMRTLRLGREFEVVLVHDAVVYLLTEADLRAAVETAALHCRPGGVALFAPDHTRESFIPSTDCGGHDGDDRALRYLEWQWDPDPTDDLYTVHYTYALRERDQPVHVESDLHICAMFPRATWFALLNQAGFDATLHPLEHSEVILAPLNIS